MRRENHAVLDDHVPGFDPRIEQQRVLRGIGDVGRIAPKDSSVVRLGTVRVADPVELPVDEADAAGFVPRVHCIRHDDLPMPLVLVHVIGASQPVALVSLFLVKIAGASVKRVFGRVVGHAVNVAANDRVVGVAQRRSRSASTPGAVIPVVGVLSEGIGDSDGLPVVGRVVDVDR